MDQVQKAFLTCVRVPYCYNPEDLPSPAPWSVHFHTPRLPIADKKLSCWFSRHHEAYRLNEAKKPVQITNGPLGETVLFHSSLGRRNLLKSLSSNRNEYNGLLVEACNPS